MAADQRTPTIDGLLGPNGRLAQLLPGYEHRKEQIEACTAIHRAVQAGHHILVEAGTGVGKSMAYLVPSAIAIAKGRRAVVSTHTINLQSQLMEKDIPLLQQLVPEAGIKPALLKGRSNYLCLLHLDNAEENLLHATDDNFHKVKAWARETTTGDSAELPFRYPGWFDLACDAETCRRKDCRYFDRCFYYEARRCAAKANLIVSNHALYLSDLTLRNTDAENRLLPDHDLVVFDEAHHLEDVATNVFGMEMDNKRIPRFVERLRRQRNLDLAPERLTALEKLNEDLFGAFTPKKQEFFFSDALAENGKEQLEATACQIDAVLEGLATELQKCARGQKDTAAEFITGLSDATAMLREEVSRLIFDETEGYIRWGAVEDRSAGRSTWSRAEKRTSLYHTPVAAGHNLAKALWPAGPVAVLTSATLASSGSFDFIRARLSAPESAEEIIVGSPFDFRSQAILYVPRGLPEPPKGADPQYTQAVADEILRLVELTEGHAFLLFTSRRMMNDVHGILADRLPFPVMKQGDSPPSALLDEFRASGNGVLFGLQSFWEGVDVQGEALSCVVIDRLPFAVPDSPINRARTQAITDDGGDWFASYALPQAQIRLKQGFGRLIRTRLDHGIVCILDTRLLTRRYGAEFVHGLPPAARASVWSRLEKLWHAMREQAPQDTVS